MTPATRSIIRRALRDNLTIGLWVAATWFLCSYVPTYTSTMLGQAILHELRHGPWGKTVTWFLCAGSVLLGFGLGRIRRTWEKARRRKVEEYTRSEQRRTA